MFAFPVLLGDIGGTNARFAVLAAPGEPIHFLPRARTASASGPIEAIEEALSGYSGPAPRSAMIAVATRVDRPVIRLTNAHWIIDAAAIGRALDLKRVVLVNDYTPLAASTVALDEARGDLARVGTPGPAEMGTRVVLGPGTGFGVAALMPIEDRFAIVATEAGHVELGPAEDGEMRLWPLLERVGGRISAEAVLSGPGLFRLSKALSALQGEICPFSAPNDVVEAARAGHPIATIALGLFGRLLGRFAGDLALTFEATGGIFIAGGIAPRMVDILQQGDFRAGFSGKAPHDEWARSLPTFIIVNPEPALLGLSVLVADPRRFIFRAQGWQSA